jgi:hypothetical protein
MNSSILPKETVAPKSIKPINGGTRRALMDVSNRNGKDIIKGGKPAKAQKITFGGTVASSNANKNDAVFLHEPKHETTAITQPSGEKPKEPEEQFIYLDLEATKPASTINRSSYQYTGIFHDIDARDRDDPQSVTAYVQDMFEYYREQEHRAVVDPQYMEDQLFITERMRGILVDWMYLVVSRLKLSADCFHLAVNILDRYLAEKKANKRNLQLVGTAAVFIASKYEDIYAAPADDLVYLCDKAYTHEQIYSMEEKILKTLNYQISIPTTYKFFLRYLNAAHTNKEIANLSNYILDESTLSIELIKFMPSQLAAASVFIARKAMGRNAWSPTLLKYSKYREEEIIPVATAMMQAKNNLSSSLTAIKKRYNSRKKEHVAKIPLSSTF